MTKLRIRHYPGLLAVLLIGIAQVALAGETSSPDGKVQVDPNKTVVASFQGMGVQWDPYGKYPPTPEKWKLIISRIDRLQPSFFRVMTSAGVLCSRVDPNGRHVYIWDEPKDRRPAAWSHFQELRAILKSAQSRNWHVMLGEWGPPGVNIDGKRVRLATEDPRWSRIIADYVRHLRNDEGFTCIRYFNLVNEPNGDWSGNKSYETWATGIRNLHGRFREVGLDKEVLIIGPDTTGNSRWLEPFTWLDRAAKDLPEAIGLYDLHWYAEDFEVFGGRIEKVLRQKRDIALKTDPTAGSKLMLLGECGLLTGRTKNDQQHRVKKFEYGVMMADYTVQTARAGWMGVTAWDLDDAMHPNTGKNLPDKPEERVLKVWGFWNSAGSECGMPEQEACRPWFYVWTVMSNLFPRGTRIVQADGPAWPRFRVLAGAAGDQLSLALVNNANEPRTIRLCIPGEAKRNLTVYHYFDDDSPAGLDGLPLPKQRLTDVNLDKGAVFHLPTRGVLFLTTREPLKAKPLP